MSFTCPQIFIVLSNTDESFLPNLLFLAVLKVMFDYIINFSASSTCVIHFVVVAVEDILFYASFFQFVNLLPIDKLSKYLYCIVLKALYVVLKALYFVLKAFMLSLKPFMLSLRPFMLFLRHFMLSLRPIMLFLRLFILSLRPFILS